MVDGIEEGRAAEGPAEVVGEVRRREVGLLQHVVDEQADLAAGWHVGQAGGPHDGTFGPHRRLVDATGGWSGVLDPPVVGH